MLDNIRRKISYSRNNVFYIKQYALGVFDDLICYKDSICSISTERFVKKTRSFKRFHKSSKDIRLKGVHMKMILCFPGTFIMGHDNEDDNQPRQEVIERAFLLGETETTQELYEAVTGFRSGEFEGSENPVLVCWYDAVVFCNKLSRLHGLEECYVIEEDENDEEDEWGDRGDESPVLRVTCDFDKNGYRLPREKEWEYAAKAGTQNKWAGTNNAGDLEKYAWFGEDFGSPTHPVKLKDPNEWGFYDMNGNVQELCWDTYDSDATDAGAGRVTRGGSRDCSEDDTSSVSRICSSPNDSFNCIGFRVCRSIVN